MFEDSDEGKPNVYAGHLYAVLKHEGRPLSWRRRVVSSAAATGNANAAEQALLQLLLDPANGDVACCKAVEAYEGDMDAICWPRVPNPLGIALARRLTRTVHALGRRGDVCPNLGSAARAPLCWAISRGMTRTLLEAFPHTDVNELAVWDRRATALHFAAALAACTEAEVLLDYGADKKALTDSGSTVADYCRHTHPHPACVAALIARHDAWLAGNRRAWLAACVAVATDLAVPELGRPPLLVKTMLGDTSRVCIAAVSAPPALVSYCVVSEYAGMVATFL